MVLAPVGMDAGALNTGIVGTNPLESLQTDNSADERGKPVEEDRTHE